MDRKPIVTLTTDFGLQDHFVGTVKGAILSVAPEAQIVDISHSVQAFDVLDGAITVAEAYRYFPKGTVHMVVVDPGVGTARRPILVNTQTHYFVAPDNGVLSLVYEREERVAVHHITAEHYFLQPVSNTFHARDIFAPVAAMVARGVEAAKVGGQIEDYIRFAAPKPKPVDAHSLRGIVLKMDRFGNLITNIRPRDVPALISPATPPFRLRIGSKDITQLNTNYADGAPGELFAIWGSMGYLEISANRGSAGKLLALGKGADVLISFGAAAAR